MSSLEIMKLYAKIADVTIDKAEAVAQALRKIPWPANIFAAASVSARFDLDIAEIRKEILLLEASPPKADAKPVLIYVDECSHFSNEQFKAIADALNRRK